MNWTKVKITTNDRGRSTPYASIGHGHLELNVAACNLIENYNKYNFVELLYDESNANLIGISFSDKSTIDSITIKRKIQNGKLIGGISICNKAVLEKLFGRKASADHTTRYKVVKDEDYNNILIIDQTT